MDKFEQMRERIDELEEKLEQRERALKKIARDTATHVPGFVAKRYKEIARRGLDDK